MDDAVRVSETDGPETAEGAPLTRPPGLASSKASALPARHRRHVLAVALVVGGLLVVSGAVRLLTRASALPDSVAVPAPDPVLAADRPTVLPSETASDSSIPTVPARVRDNRDAAQGVSSAPVVVRPANRDAPASGQSESAVVLPVTAEAPAASSPPPAAYFPVRIEVPSAQIAARVVETGLDAENRIWAPDWDAGHYVYSSKPGEPGNVVIVGHVYRGKVFHNLHQVQVGEPVVLYDEQGTEFRYAVEEIVLVPVEGASEEQIEAGNEYVQATPDRRLTLVTCWPEVEFTHRLIVIARPTS